MLKQLTFLIYISFLLFSCSQKPPALNRTWLFESDEVDSYFTFSSVISAPFPSLDSNQTYIWGTVTPIRYSCDSSASYSDSMLLTLETSQFPNSYSLKDLRGDFSLEIEMLDENLASMDMFRKGKIENELSGYLSIPDTIYPTFDQKSELTQLIAWAYFPQKARINQTQKRIDKFKEEAKLTEVAGNFISYLDSLERKMNLSLVSNYSYNCIHRDLEAYKYHPTKFLVGDPANPKDDYFSAYTP